MKIAAWLALLAALLLVAPQPSLAQETLGLSPVQRPFQSADRTTQAGQRFTFVCPASDGTAGTVYGTDVYTADSAICAAAIHAGVVRPGQPGVVTIVMGSGAESFPGSSRNGVTTRSYGPWDRSYTFARDGAPGMITWRTVWSGIPDDFVAPITVECPPTRTTDGKLWGTDVYTRDSVVCVAAVHAGAITAQSGGRVVVTRARHTGEFTGSVRNGVTSDKYGPFSDAFSVTAPARTPTAGASEAPPTSPPSGVALRTIAVAGFTAEGAPLTVRTIAIAGFTATGAPLPALQTIPVAGWTATGTGQ